MQKSPFLGLRSGLGGLQGISLTHNSPSEICTSNVCLWSFLPWVKQPRFSSPSFGDPLYPVVHRTQSRGCQRSDPQLAFLHFYTVSLWGAAKIPLEETVQTRLIGSPSKAVVWLISLKIIENKKRGRKMWD